MFQNILHIVFEVSSIKWIKESVKCTQFSKKMVFEANSASHHFSLLFVFIDVCTLHTQTYKCKKLFFAICIRIWALFSVGVCLCALVCFLLPSFHFAKMQSRPEIRYEPHNSCISIEWISLCKFKMQLKPEMKWQQWAQPTTNGCIGNGDY